ncbi:PIN domain-containing protein [Pseudactinotalea sp. HY158]|uniref:PIN domain-containing protein n=1 Tax=Pseudactinotalea sp. HY158 TaxID=2654547 RepID=UPI00129CB7F4|nr:PIN domain-containing protein [Pseudactinotalea sp. HY158]QGH69416.1 PIN domain-containing protein [Pseudactinotalea sp. HY158]
MTGRRALALFTRMTVNDSGYVTTVVLAEAYRVLTRAYRLAPADVLTALSELLDRDGVEIQDREVVRQALALASTGAQFPDAMIAAHCAARGCLEVASFDRSAQAHLGFVAP